MADLNVDPNFFEHVKIQRLIRRIGDLADAHIVRLWAHAAKLHAIDGRFSGYSTAELESVMKWTGKEGDLVRALVEIRLIDRRGKTYEIHNWLKRNGHLRASSLKASAAAKARWNKMGQTDNDDAQADARDAQACTSIAPTPTPPHPTGLTEPTPPNPANASGSNGHAGASGSGGEGLSAAVGGRGGVGAGNLPLGGAADRVAERVLQQATVLAALKGAGIGDVAAIELSSSPEITTAIITEKLKFIRDNPGDTTDSAEARLVGLLRGVISRKLNARHNGARVR